MVLTTCPAKVTLTQQTTRGNELSTLLLEETAPYCFVTPPSPTV